MKVIDIVRLNKEERIDLQLKFSLLAEEQKRQFVSFEEYLKKNENQTLNILHILKSNYKWSDLSEAIEFHRIYNLVRDTKKDKVELDRDQLPVVLKVFKDFVGNGVVFGDIADKFIEIYLTFENAKEKNENSGNN